MATFEKRTLIDASPEEVFRWHAQEAALPRLMPPWEEAKILQSDGCFEDGCRVVFQIRQGPIRQKWVAEHYGLEVGRRFCDKQIRGPFAFWQHEHRFEPAEGGNCQLVDDIEYRVPLGVLGRIGGGGFVRRKLEAMFRYRHAVTKADIEQLNERRSEPMKILMSGSSGFVGGALTPFLETGGHEVHSLVRSEKKRKSDLDVLWSAESGVAETDLAKLKEFDAVVHLAGESIAGLGWSSEKKKRIYDSRVVGTRKLCEALAAAEKKPKVLVCASAIGIYGNRGNEELTEDSSTGDMFLSRVTEDWEAATEPAREAGIRVVNLRLGVIMSPKGGMLDVALKPFKFGLGGRLGDGSQWMSWVTLDDVLGTVYHVLSDESIAGPVNVVAPKPVTNREFTKTLARVLRRPVGPPAPAFVLRATLGEMAEEMMLVSARVLPRKLEETGYKFRFPGLEEGLRHVLGR